VPRGVSAAALLRADSTDGLFGRRGAALLRGDATYEQLVQLEVRARLLSFQVAAFRH
jgi:hypothetical protein